MLRIIYLGKHCQWPPSSRHLVQRYCSSVMFYINIVQHSINPDDYILALRERTKEKINWVLEKNSNLHCAWNTLCSYIFTYHSIKKIELWSLILDDSFKLAQRPCWHIWVWKGVPQCHYVEKTVFVAIFKCTKDQSVKITSITCDSCCLWNEIHVLV